jgi:glycosyltransferase involved in cell wall biosynthesis
MLEHESTPRKAVGERRRTRLIVFTLKPKGLSPGQRFRLEQWAPYLRERDGIEMDFVPFESPKLTELLYQPGNRPEKALRVLYDFLRRASHVISARRYDGAVIYREASLIGPAIYERVLARAKVPFILDFDDAIWMSGSKISKANGIFSNLHFQAKTSTICRLASAVTVGNEFLASYAREHSRNVFILPTSIDLQTYPVQPELTADDPFVVTWSGSVHTLYNFEDARSALERFAQRRRVVVRVICNEPPSRPIAGADNEFIPWQEAGEAEAIGRTHVGIMPLQDKPFTRGKCGLKALQYMATGKPVVVSPVGMNADLIQPGQNGFVASTTDEWVDVLERLATSAELRQRLGRAGRATVEAKYSGAVVARQFADVVRRCVGS